ncbi:MAG: hypothetical protein JWQ03_2105 [Variovorax sp.]|nr:hypothetical protein [Variovorax sp.]
MNASTTFDNGINGVNGKDDKDNHAATSADARANKADDAPGKESEDAASQAKALRDRLDATWQTARDVVSDKSKIASAKAKEAAGTAHAYAREEPWQVAGAALAVGVLVGLLLGRR